LDNGVKELAGVAVSAADFSASLPSTERQMMTNRKNKFCYHIKGISVVVRSIDRNDAEREWMNARNSKHTRSV
jgi:hypothetical protein